MIKDEQRIQRHDKKQTLKNTEGKRIKKETTTTTHDRKHRKTTPTPLKP
jgi:hypothetical protein